MEFKNKVLKLACLSICVSATLHAYSLKDSVEKVLATNPEIIADKNNQEAFRKYIDEREANYLPRIDIDGRLEKSNSEKNYTVQSPTQQNGSSQEDGYNIGIALNQIIYDGNLTPSQVTEAKHNEKANKFRINNNKENVVLETVKAYIGVVQYDEILALTEDMIGKNKDNLQIAKEKEQISGEVLETYQVDSKLSFIKEKYLEEKDLKNSKFTTFKRYVGVEPDGTECRPDIDWSRIPSSLQEIVEMAVLKNNEILQQIETIKARRAKIAQADSKFLPNLGLELKALRDKDLSLNENGVEEQVYGRINLSWNLFNGGGDYAVSKQEELFLAEQKKRLDAITNKIVENVKVTYERIVKNKERIEALKDYVQANKNIVQVYKNEFESGTRTFVDILDAEMDLYEAKKSLLNREYTLYENYYSLLNTLSILSETVSTSTGQSCLDGSQNNMVENNSDNEIEDTSSSNNTTDELNSLLGDDTEQNVSTVPDNVEVVSPTNLENMSFLDAPNGYYTLNITTTKGLNAAKTFVESNNLDSSETYTYEFGPNMRSAKVIYGIYSSIREAKNAMRNLPKSVKSHKPYVDNISKHKKLYAKYH